MKARLAGLFCALVFLAGCFSLGRPAPPVHQYVLEYEPPALSQAHVRVVLRVSPFTIASAYAGPGITYRTAASRVGKYPYDRWAAEPSDMVADVLARDFAASGAYEAVIHGPTLQSSDYDLSGEVEELGERAVSGCVARVRLRVLLRRRSRAREERAVLFQRSYQEDEPCKANDAGRVVAAMGSAMERLSAQVQADVHGAISADAAAGPPPHGGPAAAP